MFLRTVIIVLAVSFWPCSTNMIYFLSFQFDALCVCWFWYTMQPYSVIYSIVCLRFSVPLLISFYSRSFLFFWANPCTRVRLYNFNLIILRKHWINMFAHETHQIWDFDMFKPELQWNYKVSVICSFIWDLIKVLWFETNLLYLSARLTSKAFIFVMPSWFWRCYPISSTRNIEDEKVILVRLCVSKWKNMLPMNK
jgi:hypothetical protein